MVRVIFLMRDHPENKAEGFLSVAVDRLLAVLVLVIMGLLFAWTRDDWFARSFAVGNLMKWFAITLLIMAPLSWPPSCSQAVIWSRSCHENFLCGSISSSFRSSGSFALKIAAKRCLERSTRCRCCSLIFRRSASRQKFFTDKVTFWDMTSIMPLVTAISSLPISLNGIGCT